MALGDFLTNQCRHHHHLSTHTHSPPNSYPVTERHISPNPVPGSSILTQNGAALGSWADEMDSQPIPSASSGYGGSRDPGERRAFTQPWGDARGGDRAGSAGMGGRGPSYGEFHLYTLRILCPRLTML